MDVALQFNDKGGRIDRCFVSPYTRAIQTADSFLSRVAGAPGMPVPLPPEFAQPVDDDAPQPSPETPRSAGVPKMSYLL